MGDARNPWEKFEAKIWKAKIPELDDMEVTFRESGDAGALVDIVFGKALGGDKNQAIAILVSTSIVSPPLVETQFNSLGLQVKLALFGEVMNHVGKGQPKDFPEGSKAGPKTESSSETDVGGPGEQPDLQVSVPPSA